MVGRVIGKNGETVKALQTYTGATIQIDQTTDPTRVSITGAPYSLSLAVSMVTDIVRGSFKGFALLRQATRPPNGRGAGYPAFTEPRPVYAPGYGLIPASQLYDDRVAPPMPTPYGLRPTDALLQQQVYPIMATGLPGQNVLLQQEGGLGQQGQASLVNAQLGQLSLSAGDLGLSANGMQQHGMQYQEPYMLGPMTNGGQVGEEFAMSASHRLIQAAGGGNRPGQARPKPWLG